MILTLTGSNIAIQNVCDCANPPQRSIARLVYCCGYGAESSWHKRQCKCKIFSSYFLALLRSLLWWKRAAWLPKPYPTTGPGQCCTSLCCCFSCGVCVGIVHEGNDTEIPVIRGRVDRWIGEEDDSVMTIFLPAYSPANTTQAWTELPQNITCELAQDLATGIHSACTDHI